MWRARKQILRFLRSKGARPDVAEDILAETFLVAWRRRHEIPMDREVAMAWLRVVADNGLRNHRRQHGRKGRLAERAARQLLVESRPTGAGARQRLEQRIVVAEAWHSLSDPDRRVLTLAGVAGLDIRSLAERLGCTPGAAAVRLSRARRRLEYALSL
jgi:RNA polymerase sigma factor (sigma-70 family)